MFPVRDTIPSRTPPVATITIILINAFVFLIELSLPEPVLETVIRTLGVVPQRSVILWASEGIAVGVDRWIWPYFTSMFLHGSLMHIVGNMWMLWIFGDNVEDRMGTARFVVFYTACGVIAGLVHTISNPASPVPTIGASGAISGVMGAYMLLFPHSRVLTFVPVGLFPFFFDLPAPFYLLYWFMLQYVSGIVSIVAAGPSHAAGGIAWWAHIGGFAAGFVLGPLMARRRNGRDPQPDEWGIEAAWMRGH